MANKIGWCSMTWNPVVGCRNNCEYCYARKMAKRFAKKIAENAFDPYHYSIAGDEISYAIGYLSNDLKNFKPTFLDSQFYKSFPKKPQRIFVGSMSEIYYWKKEWIERVLDKINQYPQHVFQFLTKYPEVYSRYDFPKNCWLGITITKENDFYNNIIDFLRADFGYTNLKFVSFEPLLSKILSHKLLKYFNWVIIGAETGNRKGKVIPKREWIENIIDSCKRDKIPIYLKDSLRDIYPIEMKKFPKNNL